jgi:hypothetical protein
MAAYYWKDEKGSVSYPYQSHDLWFITENVRWGFLPKDYITNGATKAKELIKKVNREDIWKEAAKELGGKSDISSNSGEFSIPVSQARKVVDFVKSNVSQLKSSEKTNSIKGIGDNTGPVKPGPVKTKAGSVSIN